MEELLSKNIYNKKKEPKYKGKNTGSAKIQKKIKKKSKILF